jgi:hypothetical protein
MEILASQVRDFFIIIIFFFARAGDKDTVLTVL